MMVEVGGLSRHAARGGISQHAKARCSRTAGCESRLAPHALSNMVEVGGLEPPSLNHNLEDATCFSYLLDLAVRVSDKQDTQTASFLEFRPAPQKQEHRDYPASGSHSGLPGNRPGDFAAIKRRGLTDR